MVYISEYILFGEGSRLKVRLHAPALKSLALAASLVRPAYRGRRTQCLSVFVEHKLSYATISGALVDGGSIETNLCRASALGGIRVASYLAVSRQICCINVCFGSLADMVASPRHVCFTPNSGRWRWSTDPSYALPSRPQGSPNVKCTARAI